MSIYLHDNNNNKNNNKGSEPVVISFPVDKFATAVLMEKKIRVHLCQFLTKGSCYLRKNLPTTRGL